MPQGMYLPEGRLLETPENMTLTSNEAGVRQAWAQGRILEGIATMCDEKRNLHVRLGNYPANGSGTGRRTGKTPRNCHFVPRGETCVLSGDRRK